MDYFKAPNQKAIPAAAAILGRLDAIWNEWTKGLTESPTDFITEIFGPMWENNDTGEEQEKVLDEWETQPEERRSLSLLQAALTSAAYVIQAMKAEKDNRLIDAWREVANANYWLGIVNAGWGAQKDFQEYVLQHSLAKKGADGRHRRNREMKATVLAWFAENSAQLKSKDAAAEQAAGTLVPVSFRTVREWLKGA